MVSPTQLPEMIGESPQIRELMQNIEKVAVSPTATIMIRGESGTGKELVARNLHLCSADATGPFIELNCAAIPETLLEAELMGYEQGAFTDARSRKKGLLELAHNGTIFLDEIDGLSLNLQAKLLKVIDDKVFRRLGGVEEIRVEVRIIAATNADLEESISRKRFREDLYYRLNVISLELPPLRVRGNDLLLIAEHFIQRYNNEYGKHVVGLTQGAIILMQAYHWPGNVRELKNVLERAVLIGEKAVLDAEDLLIDRRGGQIRVRGDAKGPDVPAQLNGQEGPVSSTTIDADGNGGIRIRIPEEGVPFTEVEKGLLEESLKMTRWNVRRAARLLHMSYDTFRYRMQKYGLG